MSLEIADYISQLVEANPSGSDQYSTADDHLRLIKHVLITTLGQLTGAVTASHTELNKLDGYTGTLADLNILSGAAAGGLSAAELLFVNGVTSGIQTQLNARELLANKNAANGYCGLDSGVLIPLARIPTPLTGKSADQLDGQDSTFYRNAGNLNAGSIPDARVPVSAVTQHEVALTIQSNQINTGIPSETASFAIDATHVEDIVRANSSTTINITVNTGIIPNGATVVVIRRGTGAVNFVAGAGMTLDSKNGLSILMQNGIAHVTALSSTVCIVGGDV